MTTTPPVELVGEVQAVADGLHPLVHPVVVRARRGADGLLTSCEIWTGDAYALWACRATLPAAVGLTLLDVEYAVVAAGYVYSETDDGRPRWRFDRNDGGVYALNVARPLS
jgi:hypothetical protein